MPIGMYGARMGAMTSLRPARERTYRRRADDRIVSGAAAGLARGLGWDPIVVRIAFVLLATLGGAGFVLYAATLLLLPEDPPRLRSRAEDIVRTAGIAAVALVLMGVARAADVGPGRAVVWPVVLMAVGALVLWRAAAPDDDEGDRPAAREVLERVLTSERAGTTGRGPVVARVAVGALLTVAGFVAFLTVSASADAIGRSLLAAAVAVAGIGLLLGPWLWRLASDLAAERRKRIRSEERTEMAAHLHDSVLQTLTLIQRHPERADEVARLARRQERELRAWLRDPDGDMRAGTLSQRLRALADQIEDDHGVTLEAVFVGDVPMDDELRPLCNAAGEAIRNAARHSGTDTVQLYAEVGDGQVDVFVRDRGSGFDPDLVPSDRRGIEESIRARMARSGGSGHVRSTVGEGTEVHLRQPLPNGERA
jgi:signal transduction histidine kinase